MTQQGYPFTLSKRILLKWGHDNYLRKPLRCRWNEPIPSGRRSGSNLEGLRADQYWKVGLSLAIQRSRLIGRLSVLNPTGEPITSDSLVTRLESLDWPGIKPMMGLVQGLLNSLVIGAGRSPTDKSGSGCTSQEFSQPPLTAGTIETSDPAETGLASPPVYRTFSSAMKMLMCVPALVLAPLRCDPERPGRVSREPTTPQPRLWASLRSRLYCVQR
jgi:hypothetical protein